MAYYPFNAPGTPFPLLGIPGGFSIPMFPSFPSVGSNPLKTVGTSSTETVPPPDECQPNETLYVNNLNSRVKEDVTREYMKMVCFPMFLLPNYC
jgi:hypothetical protein